MMLNYPALKLLLGKVLIFISLIIVTILYIAAGKPVALGFTSGVIAMIINWRLLAYQNEKVVKERKGGGYVYFFVFLRYAVIAAVMAGAFIARGISGFSAVAGVLFSQFYIFIFALILTNKERGKTDG